MRSFMQQDDPSHVEIETRMSNWLSEQSKRLVTGGLAILVLLTTFTFYRGSNQQKGTQELFRAHQLAEQLSGPKHDQVLEELEQLSQQHASIQREYGTLIAQEHLKERWKNHDAKETLPPSSLKTSPKREVALLNQYSLTSYTIANNQFKQAVEETQNLRKNLLESDFKLPILDCFLLLRLASLHHELGNQKAATLNWQALLEKIERQPEIITDMAAHLQEGAIDVKAFPVYR